MGKKKEVKQLTKTIVASFDELIALDPEAALDALDAVHTLVGEDDRMVAVIIQRVQREAEKQVRAMEHRMRDAGITVLEMNADEAAKFIEEHAVRQEPMQPMIDTDDIDEDAVESMEDVIKLHENKEN
jgi:hypothetical protein